jgi:hypothetical protein
MGGSYYDRDTTSYPTSTTNTTSNNFNNPVGLQGTLHEHLDPKKYSKIGENSYTQISTFSRSPIVFGLDVTGSMGEWVKIIYDKLPMFYGQVIQQKYLEDPSISFCAVGDSDWSIAPLQVSTFSQGLEIDDQIKKLFLEGGGGGNGKESYELLAYFYLNKVNLQNCQFPFLFITGDEIFFEKITSKALKKVLNIDQNDENNENNNNNEINIDLELDSVEIFKKLCAKYNVFHIRKSYSDPKTEKIMAKKWADAIGKERILDVETPKACIDVILGAISLTSGSRNLEGYIEDMKQRGQTPDRIKEVTRALILYSSRLQTGKIEPVINEFKYKNYEDEFGNVLVEELEEPNRKEAMDLLNEFKKNFIFPIKNEKEEENQQKIQKIMKDIPAELFCPITGDLFTHPVLTEDGQTYERTAIEQWFKYGHMKSPLCGSRLNSTDLISNRSIKNLVEFYKNRDYDD